MRAQVTILRQSTHSAKIITGEKMSLYNDKGNKLIKKI